VALAFPVPVFVEFRAEASTADVAGAVPPGADFVMVAEADADAETVRIVCEKRVGHELGSVELRSKARGEHPALSLLVSDTVWLTSFPAYTWGLAGESVTVGFAATQGGNEP